MKHSAKKVKTANIVSLRSATRVIATTYNNATGRKEAHHIADALNENESLRAELAEMKEASEEFRLQVRRDTAQINDLTERAEKAEAKLKEQQKP